jgi:hypothetical protein
MEKIGAGLLIDIFFSAVLTNFSRNSLNYQD